MEDILNQLEKLDNVQLRAELLKHGEKVGPVTPTTRTLFLSKLASKRYAAEHPEDSTGNIAATASQFGTERGAEANTVTGISSGLEPGVPATVTLTGAQISTPTGRKVTSGNSGDKEEPCVYYVVILANSPTASSNASTISGKNKILVSLGIFLFSFCNVSKAASASVAINSGQGFQHLSVLLLILEYY